MIEVNDKAHLESLPDGTIIRWLRIPGDQTSEAVAFVRSQIEYDDGPNGPTAFGGAVRTVWISPGGFAPQTPESAGITYPVQVVWFGQFVPDPFPTGLFDQLDPPFGMCEVQTLAKGGTWARETALKAAATFCHNTSTPLARMMEIATEFEAWLDRPVPETSAEDALVDLSEDGWGDDGPPPGHRAADASAGD